MDNQKIHFSIQMSDFAYRIIFAISHLVGMSSSVSNPIIYGYFNEPFRIQFFKLLSRRSLTTRSKDDAASFKPRTSKKLPSIGQINWWSWNLRSDILTFVLVIKSCLDLFTLIPNLCWWHMKILLCWRARFFNDLLLCDDTSYELTLSSVLKWKETSWIDPRY